MRTYEWRVSRGNSGVRHWSSASHGQRRRPRAHPLVRVQVQGGDELEVAFDRNGHYFPMSGLTGPATFGSKGGSSLTEGSPTPVTGPAPQPGAGPDGGETKPGPSSGLRRAAFIGALLLAGIAALKSPTARPRTDPPPQRQNSSNT